MQNGNHKYSLTNHGQLVSTNHGEEAVGVQVECLTSSKNQKSGDKNAASEQRHHTLVENGDAPSEAFKVREVPFKTLRSYKSQTVVRGSQHTSSYPSTLDYEQIFFQQRFLASKPDSLTERQPPQYVQPPPHESQRIQQTTSSSSSASHIQPARAIWASSSSNVTGQPAQPLSNGATVRIKRPSSSKISNQQFSRASSAGQGVSYYPASLYFPK